MVIGLALLTGFALLAWVYGPVRYKYRVTVEASTPSGVRTGSAVQMLEWTPTLPLLAASQFTSKIRGDAVALELPDGSVLFVLLSADL